MMSGVDLNFAVFAICMVAAACTGIVAAGLRQSQIEAP